MCLVLVSNVSRVETSDGALVGCTCYTSILRVNIQIAAVVLLLMGHGYLIVEHAVQSGMC